MRTGIKNWVALLLLLAGCVTRPVTAPVLPVPFVAQAPEYCGPAALAMVLQYYGQPATADEIAAVVHNPAIRGTLSSDLVAYLHQRGLWARQYQGSLGDLRQKLAAGVPLVVQGRFGNRDHYFVVVGQNPHRETVVVHTDQRSGHEMAIEEFRRFWERGGRWTLVACPPDRARWRLSADEHNDLGVFLERRGQNIAAAGHYREAATLAPTNSFFAMNLGNALAKERLFAEAVAAYRLAVRRDPRNGDALNNLAWALGETGANLDEAVELCRRALELQPAQRAYYLDTLAGIYARKGMKAEAAATYAEALAATTDRQEVLRAGIRARLAALK